MKPCAPACPYRKPLNTRQHHEPNPAKHGKALIKSFVPGRLKMRHSIHLVAQLRQRKVHAAACTALIAQRAVFGNAVPGVVGKTLGKIHLCR